MGAGITALAVLSAGVLTAASPTRPGAASEPAAGAVPPVACAWTTRFVMDPALTLFPREFTFTQTGTIGPCSALDGAAWSGKFAVVNGSGTGSCLSARAGAAFTVAWDSGTTSRGVLDAVTVGPVALVIGTIDGGQVANGPFRSVLVATPAGPLACTAHGITAAVTYGGILFGP